MASEEAFNGHSGLWLLLSNIIFAPNMLQFKLRIDRTEQNEVENRSDKNLVEECQVSCRFSACRQFRIGPNDVK